MKSKELRIGNWVEFKGEFLQIFSIVNKSTATSTKVLIDLDSEIIDKHISEVNIKNLKPIPLTEDILLKCGCKKYDYHDNYLYLEIGQMEFHIFSSDTPVGQANEVPKGCFYTMINGVIIVLQHLHQLQNLYFALTGRELEIKF